MGSYDRIIRILNDLKIYNLNGNSLIEAEMKSYCYVFEQLFVELQDILNGCFLDNVNSKYFGKYERLFSMPVTRGFDDESTQIAMKKSDMMKKRLSIKNSDFNLDGIKKALYSGGMEVDINENFEDGTVTIRILKDHNICLESKEKQAFIKSFLPVHCKLNLVE